MYIISRNAKALLPLISKVGEYSRLRRDWKIFIRSSDQPVDTRSYWSDGSKDSFYGYNLPDYTAFTCPNAPYPFTGIAEISLTDSNLVLELSVFMGKKTAPKIHCTQAVFNKYFAAESTEKTY
jgi:hypothetical protein